MSFITIFLTLTFITIWLAGMAIALLWLGDSLYDGKFLNVILAIIAIITQLTIAIWATTNTFTWLTN